ncbi:hypothetical protein NHQ30_004013 [Ciborinia camelliae]|nr:hypothetical protein NHQ30_004013 [Ciborinia camelliae]
MYGFSTTEMSEAPRKGDDTLLQKCLFNLWLRYLYGLHIYWLLDIYTKPSALKIWLFISTCVLIEIFCYMMNQWAKRAFWEPHRRKLLKGILPVVERDLDTVDYLQSPDSQDKAGNTQYAPCPRMRQRAKQFNIPSLFNRLSKELRDQNQRLETAAISSGISRDLEGQNLEFRRPTNEIPLDQQIRRDNGFYNCNCGHYGSFYFCAHFTPTIWSDDVSINSIPQQVHFECDKASIQEEILNIHAFYQTKMKNGSRKPGKMSFETT